MTTITWQDLTAFEQNVLERAYQSRKFIKVGTAQATALLSKGLVESLNGFNMNRIRITEQGRALIAARHAQPETVAPVAPDWSAVTRVEFNARMVYWKLFAGDELIDRIDDMIGASVELIARKRAVQTLYRDWTETRLDDWHTVYTKPALVAIDMTPDMLAALAEYARNQAVLDAASAFLSPAFLPALARQAHIQATNTAKQAARDFGFDKIVHVPGSTTWQVYYDNNGYEVLNITDHKPMIEMVADMTCCWRHYDPPGSNVTIYEPY